MVGCIEFPLNIDVAIESDLTLAVGVLQLNSQILESKIAFVSRTNIVACLCVAFVCLLGGWVLRGFSNDQRTTAVALRNELPACGEQERRKTSAPALAAEPAPIPKNTAGPAKAPSGNEVAPTLGKFAIGSPRSSTRPALSAMGSGTATRLDLQDFVSSRYSGDICESEREARKPTRRVRGVVCEEDVASSTYLPLPRAVVCDAKFRHRAVTDANGRFEFDAEFADDHAEGKLDSNSANDVVHLTASLNGYAGPRVAAFRNPELDSVLGCMIVMAKAATVMVSCSLAGAVVNPTAVRYTLWLAGGREVGGDDSCFISVQADAEGKAEFGVPQNARWLVSANAPGLSLNMVGHGAADYTSAPKYVFQPTIEETTEVAGRVLDLRTGRPVAGARIEFPSPPTLAFSDADGRFSMHLASDKWNGRVQGNDLSVSRAYYAGIRIPMPEIRSVHAEFGALQVDQKSELLTEVIVSMRPLVNVDGVLLPTTVKLGQDAGLDLFCSFGFADSAPFPYSRQRRTAVDATGKFSSRLFPWGRTLVGFKQGEGQAAVQKVFTIDEACWKGEESFRLELHEQVK